MMINYMAHLSCQTPKPLLPIYHHNTKLIHHYSLHTPTKQHFASSITTTITCAAKFGGGNPLNSVFKKCDTCRGRGGIDCPGCKGTGKNKKNGNIFERWKCFECQGFGLKSCPECGKGGLTPEQRGER